MAVYGGHVEVHFTTILLHMPKEDFHVFPAAARILPELKARRMRIFTIM